MSHPISSGVHGKLRMEKKGLVVPAPLYAADLRTDDFSNALDRVEPLCSLDQLSCLYAAFLGTVPELTVELDSCTPCTARQIVQP